MAKVTARLGAARRGKARWGEVGRGEAWCGPVWRGMVFLYLLQLTGRRIGMSDKPKPEKQEDEEERKRKKALADVFSKLVEMVMNWDEGEEKKEQE